VIFDPDWAPLAVERKFDSMIRSAKALLLVLFLGSVSFAQTPSQTASASDAGKADAYYHFAMGRLYAELAASNSNQNEYVAKAIEHYQQALKLDPTAAIVFEELTDLYVQSGRLQDAISQAEDVLKQNPENLDARRMLGRIYLRAISNPRETSINEDMLRKAIDEYKQITEKDPKDAESWVILGRLYRVSNDSAESEKAYNAALKSDPDSEDALTGLATMYADMGDNDRAIEKLKAAAEKAPNERTLEALAEAYERVRDYKSAVEVLKRALAISPDSDRLELSLANNLMQSGQLDEALKIYQALADDDPHDADLRLRLAEIYRSQHDLVKARDQLEQAKKIDPGDMGVSYEEANLLEAEGKSDAAIAKLKSMLDESARRTYSAAQSASRAALLKRLGFLYRGSGQSAQAVDVFRQAASLDSENASEAVILIIETYRQAKDLESAQREADAAVKKYPDDRSVVTARAEVLADRGRVDEAAAEVRAVAKGAPDYQIQVELAQIYETGKRWSDMGKALDAAEGLAKSDEEKETVWFMRGAMYERMKKYDEAEAQFRKVIDANPRNAGALNYLGYMLADRAVRLDEAHELIKKALDLDPQNGAYLDSMGWICYRQGKFADAEDLLVRALDRLGQDATVHDHLGDVYIKLGKTKEAIAQWQASVKEFESGPSADNDPDELSKVTKKLESARVRLAKETRK
jgi:tetratricopeptide (TPR) repeat protein